MEEEQTKEWQLPAESELRFEVEHGEEVVLKLLGGTAEIFGSELCVGQELTFTGRKVAVFTWKGCTLQLTGNASVVYLAEETPMTTYLNTHLALQALREAACASQSLGPRVMVIGPRDAGKTSICKLLLSYALRQGDQPLFIDLDPEEGSMTIPGCACATTISRGLDLEEGFGLSATGALTTAGSATSPLVYYFGHSSIGDNAKHFRILIDALAESVKRRMKEDASAAHAGFIVDTFGQVDSLGNDLLMHAIRAFDINVVLVMGHERLFAELSRPLKSWKTAGVSEQIRILKLPKSGGVVERDRTFMKACVVRKFREYFHGDTRCPLFAFSCIVSFRDFQVYRFGQGSLAPSSALPLGEDRKVDETQVVRVDSMDVLVHSILAVVDAEGPEGLTKKPALGFIYVSEVDSVKGKLTLVTPCPGRLPRNVLVMGSYKWSDT